MNMELFRVINNLVNKSLFWDRVMIFLSKDALYLYAVMIAVVFLMGVFKKDREARGTAVNTALYTALSLALAYFIGNIYYIDRPFVHNKVNLLYPHVEDASFPSDHATATMSIASGLNNYNKVLGAVLIIFSVAIGFSRIYVGHHSPFDIVGSYVIVFITSLIYNKVLSIKVSKLYDRIENLIAVKMGNTRLSSK